MRDLIAWFKAGLERRKMRHRIEYQTAMQERVQLARRVDEAHNGQERAHLEYQLAILDSELDALRKRV